MFGQMRSRNRVILPPCPCGGICKCHSPKELSKKDKEAATIAVFGMLLIFSILYFVGVYAQKHRQLPEHIEVNGKMCKIGYHRDCAAPLSCGHKIAICKE